MSVDLQTTLVTPYRAWLDAFAAWEASRDGDFTAHAMLLDAQRFGGALADYAEQIQRGLERPVVAGMIDRVGAGWK